jgi:hypothetical protein
MWKDIAYRTKVVIGPEICILARKLEESGTSLLRALMIYPALRSKELNRWLPHRSELREGSFEGLISCCFLRLRRGAV